MPRLLKPRTNSLRSLLYLEWLLLIVVVVSEIPPLLLYQLPRSPWMNWIGISVFVAIGWRVPVRSSHQWLYVGLHIGLILLMSLVGGLRLFHLLYIVLLIRSCLLLPTRSCFGITGIAFLLCLLTQSYRFQFLYLPSIIANPDWFKIAWFSGAIVAGLVLVFLQLLVNSTLAERHSREQLALAHDRLRQYALRVEELATAQERNRIAREIHDALGHSLTVFNLHLEAALRLQHSDPAEARELLIEAKQLGAIALQEVRQSVSALRSDPLQGKDFATAIAALITEFHKSTGIEPSCQLRIEAAIAPEVKTAIYRILQEALTNICKYAAATAVEIHLQTTPNLRLMIQDNGRGFDPSQNTTGFGLQGMRERAIVLSGKFDLFAAPNQGCRIVVELPRQNT
jgi:signal transduction histidine kinase